MKLSKLVDPQFQTTLKKLAAQEMPLRTAFALRGIIKRCSEELVKYEEVRMEALNKLGEKKEDGSLSTNEQGHVTLTTEATLKFTTDLNLLLDTDIELSSIKVADLGDKVVLTTSDLLLLDSLISD